MIGKIGLLAAAGLAGLTIAAQAQDTGGGVEYPRFTPGEWQITISSYSGGSYADDNAEGGMSRTSVPEKKEVIKACIPAARATLNPAPLVPRCTVGKQDVSARKVKADLSCGGAVKLSGNITLELRDGGKTVTALQVLSGGEGNVGGVNVTSYNMEYLGECK